MCASLLYLIMTFEYGLIAIYITGLLILIQKWSLFNFEGISRNWFHFAFILKVMTGFFLYWLYSTQYPIRSEADIFKYFDDSEVLYHAFFESKQHFFQLLFGIDCDGQYFRESYFDNMINWYKTYDGHIFNNNRTMIRINAVMRFISFGSYHIHSILFGFSGLIGLTLILKAFRNVAQEYKGISILLVLLLPTILLWSSGNLKEPLLLLFLGGAIWNLKNLGKSNIWLRLIVLCFFLLMIFITKYYVLLALLPAVIAQLCGHWIKGYILIRNFSAMLLCAAAGILIGFINVDWHVAGLIGGKRNDMIRHAQQTNAKSLFDHEIVEREWKDIVILAPEAFWDALIQPVPSRESNTLQILAFTENIFVLLFFIVCAIFSRAGPNKEAIWFVSSYVVLLYLIIGLTTPIAGALVRYKTPALPLIMILGLLIANKAKVRKVVVPGFLRKEK